MNQLFGTDGIRGLANIFPMTAEIALKVGLSLGKLLRFGNAHKPRVVIGKDTRLSNYAIENAICAGLLSAGNDVFMVGPLPTPGVSFLIKSMRCDAGIMISASHNRYQDSGIKIFNAHGLKIDDKFQNTLENMILHKEPKDCYCAGNEMGRAKRIDDVIGRYAEYVKIAFPKNKTLNNFKIVIDSANGAAHKIASEILWELGAEVIAIGNNPNGFNINDNCGSTNPEFMAQQVIEHNADIGIALDGDADRVVIVDEMGNIANGDQILAALATYLQKFKKLSRQAIVGTVLSNANLSKYLHSIGITLIQAAVGDRNVFAKMSSENINVGGERSGHIILKDYASTGDGMMTALEILGMMCKEGVSASKALNVFEEMPQVHHNIKFDSPLTKEQNEKIQIQAQNEATELQKYFGRVIVRQSGTEQIIRIMIEAESIKNIDAAMHRLIQKIENIIKQSPSAH